jgi:hypothetical protein
MFLVVISSQGRRVDHAIYVEDYGWGSGARDRICFFRFFCENGLGG